MLPRVIQTCIIMKNWIYDIYLAGLVKQDKRDFNRMKNAVDSAPRRALHLLSAVNQPTPVRYSDCVILVWLIKCLFSTYAIAICCNDVIHGISTLSCF